MMLDPTKEQVEELDRMVEEISQKLIAALPPPSFNPLHLTALFNGFGIALGGLICTSPLSRSEQIEAWRQAMDSAMDMILSNHRSIEELQELADSAWIAEGDKDIH